jgi:hypothetical protein
MANAEFEKAVARGVPRELLEQFQAAPEWTLYSTKGDLADAYFARSGLSEKLAGLANSDDNYGSLNLVGELRDSVWPAMLAALATHGEPARCFIPRHVLQAGEGDAARYVIFCFECNVLLIPGSDLIAFDDAAGLEQMLNKALKAVDIMDSDTMRQSTLRELEAETERERKAYIEEMNRRLRDSK